ncbi:MAG: hypothetical protein IT181_11450, partial [Acidobacteria bacterium]|nr:hypothetical protein [Acidobacteriota bacterium]
PRDVTFTVTGFPGRVAHVRIEDKVTHPFLADLGAELVAPDGTTHILFSKIGWVLSGGSVLDGDDSALAGTYGFTDSATNSWWTAAATAGPSQVVAVGDYRTSVAGDAAGAGSVTVMDVVFAGMNPNGTWTLRVADYLSGDVGSVSAAALTLTPVSMAGTTDTYATGFVSALVVPAPGVLANDTTNSGSLTAVVAAAPSHGTLSFASNGGFTYAPAAGYIGSDSFSYQPSVYGDLGPVTTVTLSVTAPTITSAADAHTTSYVTALSVAAPGVLANDSTSSGVLSASLVSPPSRGTLSLGAAGDFVYTPEVGFAGTDSFSYQPVVGPVAGAAQTVTVTVNAPQTAQAPLSLEVVSVAGQTATLRWRPIDVGPITTGFVLEGGLSPGLVQGSIVLPVVPFADVTLPPGTYYVRVHAEGGGTRSGPSNEVRLVVGDGVAPSAPSAPTVMTTGDTAAFSWRTTFDGGVPDAVVLEVAGAASALVPVSPSGLVTFTGLPPGAYQVRLHAVNAAGPSASTTAVVVTSPTACAGAPEPPTRVTAGVVAGRLRLFFDPPSSGTAPQGYVLDVTGSWIGSAPLTERSLSVVPPPGTYTLALRSVNACGSSAATAPVTVTVP